MNLLRPANVTHYHRSLLLETRLFKDSCVPRSCNLSTTCRLQSRQLPPRLKINEDDMTENFIKGGGSGGQKINKTNSLVQLLHHPTGLTVRCQASRSRAQNRTTARRILAERLEVLEKGDESRTRIKEERKKRKKRNSTKKKRRKYRRLGETDDQEDEDEDGEEDVNVDSGEDVERDVSAESDKLSQSSDLDSDGKLKVESLSG